MWTQQGYDKLQKFEWFYYHRFGEYDAPVTPTTCENAKPKNILYIYEIIALSWTARLSMISKTANKSVRKYICFYIEWTRITHVFQTGHSTSEHTHTQSRTATL